MPRFLIYFFILVGLLVTDVFADNLHLMDYRDNGFMLFRSGIPSEDDFKEWCDLGITEVMVLSGDAFEREEVLQHHCPELNVVFDIRQEHREPLSASFLQKFDQWIEGGQRKGKKLLFRCHCGCHRTGRLAAYYEMKYLDKPFDKVIEHLNRYGRDMKHHGYLVRQIEALDDYRKGSACRFTGAKKRKYCVKDSVEK
jgi:hypothetical protein